MSLLTDLNEFHMDKAGVYCKSESHDFAYSDGAQAEQKLQDVLSTTTNLASDSTELETQVCDWPTEYHLSSTRANLLRCLDLSGVTRVLELGCGCGAISRYIGEQSHIQIDSIEGSRSRAALAALRCKDLDNVTISSANFNDIDFPENYYDLVLFVGVTEYAGRFSERETDEEALQDLLAIAHKSTTEQGVVVVAIENRTGLKYLHGATEDHYGEPYVGINKYLNGTGIKTYTKAEWQSQIAASGFSHSQFLYPFPDYKIPTTVIHDRALANKDVEIELKKSLETIKSRDYLRPFDLGENEVKLWQGAYQANVLGELANSFLILLAQTEKSLNKLADFDIRQFPSTNVAFSQVLEPQTESDQGPKVDELSKQVIELQNQLNLLKHSRGWRWLERLRALNIPGLGRRQ